MKVAICFPSAGTTHAWFTHSLNQMTIRTLTEGVKVGGEIVKPELRTFSLVGDRVRNRNRLFRDVMGWGADHLLTFDTDHTFPDWTAIRLIELLGQGLRVVGINQPIRGKPTAPATMIADGKRLYTTKEQADGNNVEQVRYMGLGIAAIDMKIVNRLTIEAVKRKRQSIFPLFATIMTSDPEKMQGEDTFFCERLAEAEIPIHIDHYLSWHTYHIASIPLSMQDALDQRAAFEAR